MTDQVQIRDLVSVDFRTDDSPPEIQEWRRERHIPYSMSCARQVWYGTKEDFADFPESVKRCTMREGRDAYAFLLSFAAGFEENDFSTHNRSQFFERWKEVQRVMPEVAERYKELMRFIELDSNTVYNTIISNFKKPAIELAARDMPGQKKGQSILLLGSVGRHGTISDYTKRLITATEQKQRQKKGHDGFITITHPDAEVLEKLKEEVESVKLNPLLTCCFRSEISFAAYDDLAREIERNDHIYIDVPMGAYPEFDQQMIDMWQSRARRDNTLTHMKGDPMSRGGSIAPWAEAGLDNYISPEELRAEVIERNKVKRLVWASSHKAFEVCADLRAEGIKPDKPGLLHQAPNLLHGIA